jgi:hypothetical protein
MSSKIRTIFFLLGVISLLCLLNYNYFPVNKYDHKYVNFDLKIDGTFVRDFYRYKCNNIKRIGGFKNAISKLNDKSYRIDGAWFVCFDYKLALKENNCKILSFGINNDYTFDEQLNKEFKCQVESFDPFIEANIFKDLREKSSSLKNEVSLKVNEMPLWRFHRIGIVGPESTKNKNQIGWLAKLEDVLEYIKLKDEVIDIFKMDIEYSDLSTLKSLNIDYLCRYVKQLMIETHPINYKIENILEMLNVLRKLEKCFLLFKRDTRFFLQYNKDEYGSSMTEFQDPKGFLLNLKYFSNEIDMINFMITYGELYFINSNFVN